MRVAIASALAVAQFAFAAGGTIEGTVTVKVGGKPASARNALIFVEGYTTPHPSKPVVVKQAGRTFTPAIAAVVKGQQVEFINDEPLEDIYHHVFTPSGLFNSKLFKPKSPPFVTE